ncbi:ankyrin repeat-containing domain protein, partial [Baffinella frigidus]
MLARLHDTHTDPSGFKRVSKDGSTVLHEAAYCRNVSILNSLLASHNPAYTGFVNDIDHSGNTVLSCMVHAGWRDGIACLVQYMSNGDIDMPNMDGNTPLMYAAEKNKPEILSMLLSHNASIDLYDKNMTSALAKACYEGSTECVEILLSKHAALD